MMTLVVTWPGVLVGIVSTIFIEALALVVYSIYNYKK